MAISSTPAGVSRFKTKYLKAEMHLEEQGGKLWLCIQSEARSLEIRSEPPAAQGEETLPLKAVPYQPYRILTLFPLSTCHLCASQLGQKAITPSRDSLGFPKDPWQILLKTHFKYNHK